MILLALLSMTAQSDLDCANASDQPTWNLCAARDAERSDARLNAVWKRVMAWVAEEDSHVRDEDRMGSSYVAKYRAAQRAWIAFRDAECSAMRYGPPGGTGDNYVEMKCIERLNLERAKLLEERLKTS